jgi:epoxide hydrolase 4
MTQALIVIGIIIAVMALLVILVGPVRSARMERKYARFRAEHKEEHDRIDASFTQHDVEVNGIKWHYVEKGPTDGQVLLLMHGLPESWYSWGYVMPLIDPKYRVIAIDMKGYGRSDTADKDFNWHTVGKQTVALMDHLQIGKFFVAGHDWGALISSVLVDDHQNRILGYVRMEAEFIPGSTGNRAALYAQKPQWLVFQTTWLASRLLQDATMFVKTVYLRANKTPLKKEDLNYFIYEFSRPGVARCIALYFRRDNWDTLTALGKICKNKYDFPVMALQADRDPRQPVSSFADAATECPCVELKWIANSMHFTSMEQPEQVANAINDFMARARTWKRTCA